MDKTRLVLSFVLIAGIFLSSVAAQDNCFSLVVGKNASVDGYVIMAHNEDGSPPCVVNHYKVPRKQHKTGSKVALLNGGRLDQVEETYSYIHSEIPEFLFSDSYINEFGVTICSDACPSREDNPELTEGGISYMLRALVAQRARSAREGVHIAAELMERFGYDGSGRTYVISDPNEGWLFCAVNGIHWVAKRVPDDEVALVANTYTVRQIDLADSMNYLGKPDIIDYAVSRGWYNPETDGDFDFARAYASPESASHPANIGRHWAALRLMAKDSYSFDDELPLSVEPKKKLAVTDIKRVLRDHYEVTDRYEPETQNACSHIRTYPAICRDDTRTSFVVQLRANRPLDHGIVYWATLGSPCTSFYIPFYFGIVSFPEGYTGMAEAPSDEYYAEKIQAEFRSDRMEAFWTFSNFHRQIDGAFHDRVGHILKRIEQIEASAHAEQAAFEKMIGQLYATNLTAARDKMLQYSDSLYLAALGAMTDVMAGI